MDITFEEWRENCKNSKVERRTDYIGWDEYFMEIAKLSARRSKDPARQVGACIVSEDNRILSIGYNGAPNGFPDEYMPWGKDKQTDELYRKFFYSCHAEMNAIVNFRGSKKDLEKAKIYLDLFPCNECAKIIIQSGIKEVIYLSDEDDGKPTNTAAKMLFETCGVSYRQFIK